jgi:hypothetical protein
MRAQNKRQFDSLAAVNLQLKAKNDSLMKARQQQTVMQNTPKNKDTRPINKRLSFDVNANFWINAGTIYF